MLNGKPTLLMDQHGQCVWVTSLADLHRQVPGRISRMYCDKKDGKTCHVGYVVGGRWFTAYRPVEKEV